MFFERDPLFIGVLGIFLEGSCMLGFFGGGSDVSLHGLGGEICIPLEAVCLEFRSTLHCYCIMRKALP